MPDRTIVGLLQNMWFHDPEGAKKTLAFYYEKKGDGGRERFIKDMLFFGCLTGRRLRAAFGDLCDDIVWEEASPELGGHASSKFPHDPAHVVGVIEKHKPHVFLAFGKIAEAAVKDPAVAPALAACGAKVIHCPHPAARGGDVVGRLRAAAEEVSQHA